MSGHSKWHNIRLKKERVDSKRGKIFTRISKEIMLAVKEGGPDVNANFRLSAVIDKARSVNMPKDNIQRAIDKASGALDGEAFEELTLEGYGPGGVAILVHTATDNKNRTVPEVRSTFSKYGGSMGAEGCVMWKFDKKGIITVPVEETSEDELMMIALEAGAEDFAKEEDMFQITTDPGDYMAVKKAIQEAGVTIDSADLSMVPQTEVTLDKETAIDVMKLMENLEELDDVQNIDADFNIPDDIMAEIGG